MKWCVGLLLLSAVSLVSASDPQLIEAIQNRDQKTVLAILARGGDVNQARGDGSTPLAWAVIRDDAEIAAALIKAGADVNIADENGETPLLLAAANGNPTVVRMLIEAKAKVNTARWSGDTPLLAAAHSGNAEVIKLLLDNGARLDVVESRMGQTPLMWAAAKGKADAVQLLIDRGANVKAVSKTGFTPLLFAAQSGDVASVKALIAARADPDAKAPDGTGAFALALVRGHEDVARLMLDYGVDVNQKDRSGSTPLHEAVRLAKGELVHDLVKRGANLEAVSGKPMGPTAFFRTGELTPFLAAAENGSIPMMKLLIDLGANPKAKNPDGVGAVTLTTQSRKFEALKFAVETLGLSVNEPRKGGGSPMHTALRAASIPMLQFLVDHGADLTVKDRFGRTPMETADFEAPKPVLAFMKKLMEEKAAPK